MEDVAFRVIAAQQCPITRRSRAFVERHQDALAELFGEVLALCAQAGLVGSGVVAVDGTKITANASRTRTRRLRADRARGPRGGRCGRRRRGRALRRARGDELPPELATAQGAPRWLREAKRRLEHAARRAGAPIPRDRARSGCAEAKRRLEEELWTECAPSEAYEAYRARGVMPGGGWAAHGPKPYTPPATPEGEINTTDPDSRNRQGAARLAAGLQRTGRDQRAPDRDRRRDHSSSADFGHLEPMVDAARRELAAPASPSSRGRPRRLPATGTRADAALAGDGIPVLIPPDAS